MTITDKEIKVAVTPKVMNVDAWNILKTVLKTDLEYWKQSEGQALLAKGNDQAIKMALSVIGTSIGITEYYIDIVDKIEKGELSGSDQERSS